MTTDDPRDPAATPEPEQVAGETVTATDTEPQKRPAFSRPGAWVAIVLTIIGGLAVVSTLSQSIWSSAVSWPQTIAGDSGDRWGDLGWDEATVEWQYSFSAEELNDVTAIAVDSRASELIIQPAMTDEATLSVANTPNRTSEWSFEIEDDTLVVSEVESSGSGWGEVTATLKLPQNLLETAPALDVAVSSGAVDISGDYGDVALRIESGAGAFVGSAKTLDVAVESGAFDVEVDDVTEATITVGSGVLGASIRGEQPESIVLDVTSGFADLGVPAGDYIVSGEADSGGRDVNVSTSSKATATLEVNVSSGGAMVHSADA